MLVFLFLSLNLNSPFCSIRLSYFFPHQGTSVWYQSLGGSTLCSWECKHVKGCVNWVFYIYKKKKMFATGYEDVLSHFTTSFMLWRVWLGCSNWNRVTSMQTKIWWSSLNAMIVKSLNNKQLWDFLQVWGMILQRGLRYDIARIVELQRFDSLDELIQLAYEAK